MRTPEHNAKIGASLRSRGRGQQPKTCPRCGQLKPRTEFKRRSDGYSESYCIQCAPAAARESSRRSWLKGRSDPARRERQRLSNRRATLKRYYGMTLDQYDELLSAQGGACAICGGKQTHGRTWLDVDHDHETGRIRGLLCSHCNRAIGFLFDDPERLRSAISYLERGAS